MRFGRNIRLESIYYGFHTSLKSEHFMLNCTAVLLLFHIFPTTTDTSYQGTSVSFAVLSFVTSHLLTIVSASQ